MDRIPVECITKMKDKQITPLRLRYEDRDGAHVINIERILQKDKQISDYNMNGARSTTYSFKCETVRDEIAIPFKLTFNSESCRWYMYI